MYFFNRRQVRDFSGLSNLKKLYDLQMSKCSSTSQTITVFHPLQCLQHMCQTQGQSAHQVTLCGLPQIPRCTTVSLQFTHRSVCSTLAERSRSRVETVPSHTSGSNSSSRLGQQLREPLWLKQMHHIDVHGKVHHIVC